MLTIPGASVRCCDGLSRRSFLQIGGLAVGGLSLADVLRAEQVAGASASAAKSVIMVYLTGGLGHQDTFDLKLDAPAEIRGEFQAISSSVPGCQVGELLPLTAECAHRWSVVRSLVGLRDEHSSFQNVTGFSMDESQREGKPNFGSIVSHKLGQSDSSVPAFVDLFPTMQHRPYNSPQSGVLGPAHRSVQADGEDLASMKLRFVEPQQLDHRRKLLAAVDRYRHEADASPIRNMDSSYDKAFDVLTSSRLVNALDVTKEDPRLRDRYGVGSSKHLGDGAPMWNDQLLAARRLVEAGVRCVTVAYGFWDTHGNNFAHLKNHLPLFDKGISALVNDIYDRGLDRDVTVCVWGEFGRTPKINKDAGRDHWPRVGHALLAGGGLKVGQVLGATDKLGGEVLDRPIHYQQVLATLYHSLGLGEDPSINDVTGRRLPILNPGIRPIGELIG
jgi:Protein of unknown function (DUF1501)